MGGVAQLYEGHCLERRYQPFEAICSGCTELQGGNQRLEFQACTLKGRGDRASESMMVDQLYVAELSIRVEDLTTSRDGFDAPHLTQ